MNEGTTATNSSAVRYGIATKTSRRNFRYWFAIAVLLFADIAALGSAELLFRTGRDVPSIAFYGNGQAAAPIDLFYILAGLFLIVRLLSGDYGKRQSFWDGARATTVSLIVASIPDILVLVAGWNRYAALWPIGCWIYLLFAIPSFRQLARFALSKAGIWQIPTALVAKGNIALDLYPALSSTLALGFDIQWLVLEQYDYEVPESLSHLKVAYLPDPEDVALKMGASGCVQAVIATDDIQAPAVSDMIQRLMEANMGVAFVPSLRRLPLAGMTSGYFLGRNILLFQMRDNLRALRHRFAKRAFDIVGSIGFLIMFSPLFLVIAIAIKRNDGGSVFYSQRRTGRRGKQFQCMKFRTMEQDADERLERWRKEKPELYSEFLLSYKLKDDPRITGPGRWLRKTSLDELPQLINVLRGEMSLVGPRPIPEQQLREQYGVAAELYVRVRPGLTGLWQVSGRNETTLAERVTLDEWYILNWTFWNDIVILIQTAWIVFSGHGAY
ncbi:MAG: exopolysaccharide biosynthesis polyprenyl glycosylphosphotransferase [Rhizomicrobium sp.]